MKTLKTCLLLLPVIIILATAGVPWASAQRSGSGTSCPAPAPLNTPVSLTACSVFSGQTCLDATFGNGHGLVLTNTDGSISSTNDIDGAQAVEQQADGKLVAIGNTTNPNKVGYPGVAAIRYNPDGSLDATFGSGGIAKFFPPGSNIVTFSNGTIDAGGNLLAVGDQGGTGVVVRFTSGGALDTSFNSSGYAIVSNIDPFAMLLQPDGKILLAGSYTKNTTVGIVIRLNPNGTLDTTFGLSGRSTFSSLPYPRALALQIVNSQQYVITGGGTSPIATASKFGVVRLTSSGALDSSFGAAGLATFDFCGFGSKIYTLTADANGNILTGGRTLVAASGSTKFGIARFASNGVLDTTFGNPSTGSGRTGYTVLDFYGSQNYVNAVQLELDSSGNEIGFLVGGYVYQTVGSTVNKYLVVAGYHADGSLDATFGTSGGVALDFGSASNYVTVPGSSNLLIQTDGKVVTAGTAGFNSGPNSGYSFAVARLWP